MQFDTIRLQCGKTTPTIKTLVMRHESRPKYRWTNSQNAPGHYQIVIKLHKYDQSVNNLSPISLLWQETSTLGGAKRKCLQMSEMRLNKQRGQSDWVTTLLMGSKSGILGGIPEADSYSGGETEKSLNLSLKRPRRRETTQDGRCKANVPMERPWWR